MGQWFVGDRMPVIAEREECFPADHFALFQIEPLKSLADPATRPDIALGVVIVVAQVLIEILLRRRAILL